MIAGQCDAGKALLRKSYESMAVASYGPAQIDKSVQIMAGMHCQGSMSPRDELVKAFMDLSMANNNAKVMSAKECEAAYKTVIKHKDVQPTDDEDSHVIAAQRDHYAWVPGCFSRAGDCERAWSIFKETFILDRAPGMEKAQAEKIARASFESFAANKKCADKIAAK